MPRPDVALVPFVPRAHAPLLARWLAQPHVRAWWGEPEAALRETRIEGLAQALVAADGRPVGYLRWQRASREELDALGLVDVPTGSVDLDILLGEPDALGRGVGSAALALLVERLRADPAVPAVGMSASVRNGRAIRAYEKAGFARLRAYDDPEAGPSWLLLRRLDRGAAAPETPPARRAAALEEVP
jgi:aminoglycoside 6'-N-acetyltransferase